MITPIFHSHQFPHNPPSPPPLLLITRQALPHTKLKLACCHSNPVERASSFSCSGVIYRGVSDGFIITYAGLTQISQGFRGFL